MNHAHVRVLRLCGAFRAKGHTVPEDLLAAEWKAVDKAKTAAERRLATAVQPVLAEAALSAGVSGVNVEVLTAELLALLPEAVQGVVRAGWASGAVRIGQRLPFDADRPAVRETVARLVGLAESVPQTLASRVDTIIRDGLASGLDGAAIGRAIADAVPEMTANQAALVGETTGGSAFEAGQMDVFSEAGVERKRWLSMRDDRVREEHAAMDGEEVALDEAFSNGEDYPQGFRCRCTTLPVIPPASAGGGKSEAKAARAGDRPTWRDERDARIRADYPALRDATGAEAALSTLAERESLSYDQTRKILYRGNRRG